VGGREVGFMAGMMKKLSNNSACVFTGKGLSFGGSLIRPEATGYGLVYFTEAMLKRHGLGFEGMRVAVSGSGNVAQFAIEKAMEFGARWLPPPTPAVPWLTKADLPKKTGASVRNQRQPRRSRGRLRP
jgi:glutamate dehydrogenase/leucine dehydrogenase